VRLSSASTCTPSSAARHAGSVPAVLKNLSYAESSLFTTSCGAT
jgi:hypothetical protein